MGTSNAQCPAPSDTELTRGVVGLCSIQLSYGRGEPGELPDVEWLRKHPDRLTVWVPSEKDLRRFWPKVDRSQFSPGGCWPWLGAKTGMLYGSFAIVSTKAPILESAHKVSFRLEHGRGPRGILRHKCDLPVCVNPAHLLEGTQKQNVADCIERGRFMKGGLTPEKYAVARRARRRKAASSRPASTTGGTP